MNAAYDAFTAKYGLLNDRKNGRLFEQDSSYYLLCSLENLDEQGQLKSKAAMFTKRTIRPERTVTSVDTPSEALAVSIGEHGKVDLPYMAELLGTPGDIIFLQKRDRPIDHEPDWVQLGKTEDGFAINQYFVDHPEMVLGVLSTESTQYGREELTVAPIEGTSLADQLAEAVQHIEGQYTEVEVETPDIADAENEKHILPADPDVKNFSYTVVDGEVFYRENSVMTQVELSDTAKGRVTGMVELRQIVNDLIQQQLEDYPDEDIKATQAAFERRLRCLYRKVRSAERPQKRAAV